MAITCCDFIGPYSGNTYFCRDCDSDPARCAQEKCGCADAVAPGFTQPELELRFSDKDSS